MVKIEVSGTKRGLNPREWLIDVIGKMPYYQNPGNEENLRMLLPNYWKKEVTKETLVKI
jgi:hypothetical protein